MPRKSAYEKRREAELEAKRRANYEKHQAWGDLRFRQGRYVISDIKDYHSIGSTVVKFKRNGEPTSEIQTRDIWSSSNPRNPPYWLRPEGPVKDTGKRFKIGHVYEATQYWGGKAQFIVVKRDDDKQMLTIQSYYKGGPYGDKIRRKIQFVGGGMDRRFERIDVDKGIYSSRTRCWTGGYCLESLNEVKRD